jgi:hypothetical protein
MAFQIWLIALFPKTSLLALARKEKGMKRTWDASTKIDQGDRDMTFHRKVFFALMILAMGFAGGVFAQIWLTPSKAEAAINRVFQGSQIFLYGPDNNPRLQMATYSAKGERGLPLIGFSDNKGGLRLLFRLAGRNESPVLVFKDKKHQDRMVIGLGMTDRGEEPFIAFFDKSGDKHLLMGEYPN